MTGYVQSIRTWSHVSAPMLRRCGSLPICLKCQQLCRWISCRKNTGYHATDPKIRTQGAERGRSWIATKHGDGSLECRTHYALQRGTPSFTQVQGPRGEVKPLLPAFLYCDATPREEYKVLVTKL
jgi:hypothetical protein